MAPHFPKAMERRRGDRRQGRGGYAGPERRTGRERRVRSPGLLTPGLESGWLCFENGHDKRRLTPIPEGWEECSDRELEQLCHSAWSVARRIPA